VKGELERDCSMGEIRDGFEVTDARKKLWKIELDLLDIIETICEVNGLNYFLIGGAAIGAARHKGFIPWDDDIDIGMLRPDFEKLVSIIQSKQMDGYTVQYGIAEGFEKGTFLRVRDLNSTAIIRSQMNIKDWSHGVFIEIYPFDKVPQAKLLRKTQKILSSVYKSELDHRIEGIPFGRKSRLLHILMKNISTEKIWRHWNNICQRYNDTDAEYVDTPALPCYVKAGIYLYPVKDVKSSVKVQYEDRMVRVATGNDRCLQIHFGDYMKLPPVEQRGTRHNSIVFYDPEKSFGEYMDMVIPKRYFNGEHNLSPI